MHTSNYQDSLNSGLVEDQKNYRKLRKILRQIEHLVILPRNLNKEEENKVSKRKFYRDQLEALTLKYKNQSELLTETHEKETENSEPNSLLLNESIEEKYSDSENIKISSTTIQKDEEENIKEENFKNVSEIALKEENFKSIAISNKSQSKKKNKKSEIPKETVNVDELATKFENIDLETKELHDKKQFASKKEDIKSMRVPIENTKKSQIKASFSTQTIEKAHEDLILTIDICAKFDLIATAGRDTTIRIWNLNGLKLHSFGGHSKSITFLKFWSYKSFLKAIDFLKNNEKDDELDDLNFEMKDKDDEKPLCLSSSLDCNFRLWSISKGVCIKSIYLYNPINNFDVIDTSFLIALEAGKIEYWKNLSKACETKMFNDSESVSSIKFFKNNTRKFFAMTSSGDAKIGLTDDNQSILCLKTINLYEIIQAKFSKTMNKNFKFVEILDEDKIIVINDNQSFIILYDFSMEETTFKLISTNSNSYGFTNCFYKFDNQILISSYNIDDASSAINVFKYDSTKLTENKEFEYQFSLKDKDDSQTYCISTLVAQKLDGSKDSVLVSGSKDSLKIWKVCEDNSKINQIKFLKMCSTTITEVVSSDPESGPENEDDEVDLKDDNNQSIIEKETSTKKSCLLQ